MKFHLEDVFKDGGWLSEEINNYKFRHGQLKLALAVEKALTGRRHLLADAPTGTGKSMAYGIPAALHALATSYPVVIVTANITLQEQLIGKDLPLISKVLDGRLKDKAGEPLPELEFALVKGMGNYVCMDKMEELTEKGADDDWFLEINDWYSTTATGDKSELPVEYPPKVWGYVSSSSEECTKSKCAYYEECFALAGRRTGGAHVIVTNYHMYYTDILVRVYTHGMSSLLPPHVSVIMDEGHEAVDIAQSFGGFEMGEYRIKWLANSLRNVGGNGSVARSLIGCAESFFRRLENEAPEDIIRRPLGFDGGLVAALKVAAKHLSGLKGDGADERVMARRETLASSMETTASKLEAVTNGLVVTGSSNRSLPKGMVYYVDQPWGKSGTTTKLCCKQVEVQGFLRENVYGKKTLVAVSATLASGGSFKFIGGEFGLSPSEYDTEVVGSPFDPSRMLLVVPKDVPVPRNREKHMAFVSKAVLKLVRDLGGKTMALFTSYKALRDASSLLCEKAPKGVRILTQGEMPKSRIIETFKKSKKAVILGTSSFWQGVDIPGQALSCLIIDKFPFLPPSDPVLRYMEDKAELDGGSAFFEYSVPKAIIALKQGVGRLIRTEDDYGVVVLCDNRLYHTGYGGQFRKAFPPGHYRSEDGDLADVKHFLESVGSP